jgi:ATP-dependent Clp protease ATP-binding subunit ClpA
MAAKGEDAKDYTAIQMTDQSNKGSNKQENEQKGSKRKTLERPFDEEFWNKVKKVYPFEPCSDMHSGAHTL